MSGKITFCKTIVFICVVFLCLFSYFAGKKNGQETGISLGYLNGQVDLALAIKANLNETIGPESDVQSYRHFKNIKDMTLYVVMKNDVKTIAFWKSEK